MKRAWRVAAIAAAAAIAFACGDSKSGPNTPLSIEFAGPQLPSMIVNDQLRDTLGNIDSLRAVVFNAAGDTIHDAPLRYQRADTSHVVSIDSISGHVTALDTGFARVVAQTSGLQSPPDTIFVVQKPDSVKNQTPLDTVLDFKPVRTDTVLELAVGLTAAGLAVDHWRIEYSIIYPANMNNADSTHLVLVDDNKKFSLVDTTGVGIEGVTGTASRSLRASPFTHQITDSVVVEARAFYPDHTPVPGSPVRFKVDVTIQ